MRFASAVFALLLALPAAADAAEPEKRAGLLVLDSVRAPADAAATFKKTVEAKGVTVIATVDHAGAARKAGLEMEDAVLLIFGNPKIGTPLMQDAPTMAADLPMRAIFWRRARRLAV